MLLLLRQEGSSSSILLADRITADVASDIGVWRLNLKHDVKGTQGESGRVNKVVGRTLYAVPVRHLVPVPTVSEQTSQTETNGVGMEALISVWWDQPPYGTPQ